MIEYNIACDSCGKGIPPNAPVTVFRMFDLKYSRAICGIPVDVHPYDTDFHICGECLESVLNAIYGGKQ